MTPALKARQKIDRLLLRKLRLAMQGRGKSVGDRVIYYLFMDKHRIDMLMVYPESKKDDLAQLARKDAGGKAMVAHEVLKLYIQHGARYSFPATIRSDCAGDR